MEITKLICIFNGVISAIFVVTFHGYSIRFNPTVSRVLIGYSVCGLTSTKMREYVTVRPTDIYLCLKNE